MVHLNGFPWGQGKVSGMTQQPNLDAPFRVWNRGDRRYDIVTFTVVDGFGEEKVPNHIEEWCNNVARHECTQRGIELPTINFRYSKPSKGTFYYSERTREEWENWPGKKRTKPCYCEQHQQNDLCDPIYEVRRQYSGARERRHGSSGHAQSHENPSSWRPNISVTFGADETDRYLVFLHELAHWLMPVDSSHDKRFWKMAFHLYDKYGIDRDTYLKRELPYKKAAGRVAAETGRTSTS